MKPGDMPARGAVVAVMLAGERPYARVYVPERVRATVREGDRFQVSVEGIAQPFPARVRHLESQATFTPYFALHGDDASRLTYLAELTLEGEAALKLPAGLPVQARPDPAASAGGPGK
jgi:HlyD family secretion protein